MLRPSFLRYPRLVGSSRAYQARRLLLRRSLSASITPAAHTASMRTPERTLRPATQIPSRASSTASAPASDAPPELEKPDYLDAAESTIWDTLVREFAPTELSVRDISGGCGSMYGIEVASPKFRGVNMLKQQRMVNAALGDMVKQWHGVQLQTRAS